MTYLLSLLGRKAPSAEELATEKKLGSLCYYVNDTKFTQIIRVTAKNEHIFEYLVFPLERILFEAPARASLKVSTFLLSHIKTIEFECQRLRIAEKYDF